MSLWQESSVREIAWLDIDEKDIHKPIDIEAKDLRMRNWLNWKKKK